MSIEEHKIVVLGGGAVGKSALTVQYMNHHFVESYDPTIEDSYRKQIEIDGRVCLLDVLDTAGQDEYSALRDQYMRTGQAFIMVYDITNYNTFAQLEELAQQLCRTLDADNLHRFPIVVAGNKVDLDSQRQVTLSEGQQFALRHGAKFLEVSAKTRINVDETFAEVVRRYRVLHAPKPTPSDSSSKKGKRSRPQRCSIM